MRLKLPAGCIPNLRFNFFSTERHASTSATEWRRVISEKNASINAFVYTCPPPSTSGSTLDGVSIAVKDNICTENMPTTCSSSMLRDFTSPYEATVVDLLRKTGADIIGKTNCDEFGMGSLNTHSIHGPVVNPYNLYSATETQPRSAGGSSGGSAAAVAAGMCYAALGTDTGGSIRLPALIVVLWGVVSFADSLDCVGVMAATVPDVARIFDPTAATAAIRERAAMSLSQRGFNDHKTLGPSLRIGVPQQYFPSEMSPSIIHPFRRVMSSLVAAGATVIPVSLPSTSHALSAYYVLASAEASSNMARYDGIQYGMHVKPPHGSDATKTANVYAHTRSAGFGSEVKKRILLGTYALTADAFDNYFLQAQRARQLVKDDFNSIFRLPDFYSSAALAGENADGVDVLMHPSAIRTAPPLSSTANSDIDTYVQDVLTVPASLAGLPALSVPCDTAADGEAADGWPIGVSVVGQWGSDLLVLKVGELIERLRS
ncbi:amidase signature domain-containing protein [Infundibulicybe gibba]|nr:amidase signature domain-containing protein [Infundibulicybe gibba]